MKETTENMLTFRAAADAAGLSEDGARYYVTGAGVPKFPAPFMQVGHMKYYRRLDIMKWNKKRLEGRKKNA